MLRHSQCQIAREATDSNDPDDEINAQFDCFSDSEKENIINDLLVIMKGDEYPPSISDWREISKKGYWISHTVLFCVYMEWKSKQHK